jgi:hypothetical protein
VRAVQAALAVCGLRKRVEDPGIGDDGGGGVPERGTGEFATVFVAAVLVKGVGEPEVRATCESGV